MCLGAVGDVFDNEVSHMGNLFSQIGKNPLKSVEQFALGAADPLGAKLWGGITGQDFTPLVGQLGGETGAQFEQSRKQGVNTGPSQTLGQIANVIAGAWGAYGASGALGGAGGSAGGAEGVGTTSGEALGTGATEAGGGGAASGFGGVGTDAAVAGPGGAGAASGFGGVGTDAAVAGPGAAAGNGSSLAGLGKTTFQVLGPTVASSLLAPKPPKTKAPTAMPDPLAQEQAQRQKILDQMARRGRASTILTSAGGGGGSLGG